MIIFIIGPGGVGKTTSGEILAKLLSYKFIDLDQKFCEQIENIGTYINNEGYKKYCYKNSELFYKILKNIKDNVVYVLSSGFLVHENLDDLVIKHKHTLKESGISILLLPSNSIKECCKIIVDRQLSRGFGLNKEKEKEKFISRFPKYLKLGDIQIFSYDKPELIAERIEKELVNKKIK